MFKNFMEEALDLALIAQNNGEVPVGAVIVEAKTNKIVARSHNLVESLNDPTAHAEILVIRELCKKLKSKFLNNHYLYVTLQPCKMCMQAIVLSKIERVYFGAYDLENPIDISSCNFKPEIYGGVSEAESSKLLKDFFAKLR